MHNVLLSPDSVGSPQPINEHPFLKCIFTRHPSLPPRPGIGWRHGCIFYYFVCNLRTNHEVQSTGLPSSYAMDTLRIDKSPHWPLATDHGDLYFMLSRIICSTRRPLSPYIHIGRQHTSLHPQTASSRGTWPLGQHCDVGCLKAASCPAPLAWRFNGHLSYRSIGLVCSSPPTRRQLVALPTVSPVKPRRTFSMLL